jgi:antitoxin VapB
MHQSIVEEFEQKEKRIHQFMDEKGWEGVVIGTQANFSWLSGGGASRVLITGEGADALLVLTRTSRTLIAYNMDGQRNIDEEVNGLGFDLVMTKWNEKSREDIAREILGGKKTLSDIPFVGAEQSWKDFYNLHYPLTEWEIDRYRQIGRESELLLLSVLEDIKPGMTEVEVERKLMAQFIHQGYIPAVVLVGSGERNLKYRHPIPSDNRIGKDLMLVLCNRKFGLHVPITRMVWFGDHPDPVMMHRFEAANTIAATCIAHSTPGTRFADIWEDQKRAYQAVGFSEGWRFHFPGGITGYIPNDSSLAMDPEAVVVENQAFNWFITLPGVNTEDTYISGKDEIITTSGEWPVQTYNVNAKDISLPKILCL